MSKQSTITVSENLTDAVTNRVVDEISQISVEISDIRSQIEADETAGYTLQNRLKHLEMLKLNYHKMLLSAYDSDTKRKSKLPSIPAKQVSNLLTDIERVVEGVVGGSTDRRFLAATIMREVTVLFSAALRVESQ